MAAEAAELISRRHESGRVLPTFGDCREMLAKVEADVAVVGTPDHWHALPTVDACKAGLDVYVQKPISLDVVEGQAMLAAARKYGRTVQVGLQRRSTPHLLEAKKRLIDSGELKTVAYVDSHSYFSYRKSNRTDATPPDRLDWDRYVGPAPELSYHPKIHPRAWRSFTNFGNGQMGDLCVHFLDFTRMLLGLGRPETISATGGRLQQSDENIADIADGVVRLRRDAGRLESTQLGHEPRARLSVGGDALRRPRDIENQCAIVRLHPEGQRPQTGQRQVPRRAVGVPGR